VRGVSPSDDALFEAWIQWKRDWEKSKGAPPDSAIAGTGSAAKVRQMLRNEVKRQVIAWFARRVAVPGPQTACVQRTSPRLPGRDRFRPRKAIRSHIQFLRAGLRVGNLNYVLYPYYWAERARWTRSNEVSAANPDLERFLKLVPRAWWYRASSNGSAVLHWLAFREPFLGPTTPLPGDPLFVSLAQEIRDLTQPPTDGELGDSWRLESARR